MSTNPTPNNKRPTCPSCTRPTKLCLCTRFKTPILDNTISVTILQHSLEKKHPLNSAKIATLGLKNISIVHVSDVLNEAQFEIQLVESNADVGQNGSVEECEKIESLHVFESNGDLGRNDSVENCEKIESLSFCDSSLDVGLNGLVENGEKMESLKPMDISFTIDKKGVIIRNQGFDTLLVDQCAIRNGFNVKKIRKANDGKCVEEFEINVGPGSLLLFPSKDSIGVEDIDFDFEIQLVESNADVGQNGSVEECEKIESLHVFESNGDLGPNDSVENCEKIESLSFCDSSLDVGLNGLVENGEKMESLKPMDISFTIDKKGVIIRNQGFDTLLVDQCAIRNGFNVKKIRKANDGKCVEEFEINVGPGSLLLFPSKDSIGVEDIDFDVKNLIVLDGTWRKATRMYKENPWLKLLPHLKLDIDKLSMYAEVRKQPKAGYLSSIESIVYAMKAIGGEDVEKLDCLLDVFESMVADQRRCKDEALKLVESNISSM
ncbi:hypothetical protein CTI12_AA022990 [Artemisia annua]|uniref:tRNA-uridine aminocarboxypropyltransferase n=1 Tax=Artemisia annua TaxID=35608 RepID=A0A2U1QJB4_ARTAN|nr:hypothetical protein CTI12_AA022990 [Artemisia annua]